MSKPYGGRIENWSFNPEYLVFFGELYDDPNKRFGPDGTSIHTSMCVNYTRGVPRVETLNTIYKLGVPREHNHNQ